MVRDATNKLVIGEEFEQVYELSGEEPINDIDEDEIRKQFYKSVPSEHLKFQKWVNKSGPEDFDEETMDRLDALGYV